MSETTSTRGERKVREGLVVSDKMDKTIVVSLEEYIACCDIPARMVSPD
jgi:small subunit ribosomal protein S17